MGPRSTGIAARTRRLIAILANEIELQAVVLTGGIVLIAVGAGLWFRPAGFLAPGLILVWLTLPSRPRFVARQPERK